jgi:hypothetical protein
VTESYRALCTDAGRARVRERAFESGDDVARRQRCYCEDSAPCSANYNCSDLVACFPQLVRSDVRSDINAAESARL